jgi:hypothetical protein
MLDNERERELFEANIEIKYLDKTIVKDAWGKDTFFYSHVEAMWKGWQARANLIPDGYVLCPIEPTDEMLDIVQHQDNCGNLGSVKDVWKAFIGAVSVPNTSTEANEQ